nr:hypothetical protein [Legionella jordanis]
MGRPVALLDVDHTLLFDDTFNENLLNSLKKNGIQDVYLFTDMRFRKLEVEDRVKLVQRLQAQGFRVHGVITPMDLVWSHMSAGNTATLNSAIIEGGYKGKFIGKPFDDFLKSKQEEIPFIQDVMTYSADSCEPGISFRHAVEAYNRIPAEADETTPLPDEMFERSSFGKVLGDCHAERQNFAHTKALMLDVFLRHKPDWANSVIVADDNENVLQAIGQYKERVNPAIAVSSIAVRNDSHPVSYYDDIIEQHLSNDPEYKIIKTIESRIDQHIEALNKTNWNIFLTSSDAKVKALEMLKSN